MIAGYILTGGKNTRMNGKKKLFLTYQGMPFYTHIFRAFHTLHNIYLSVEAESYYQELNIPMVKDLYPDIGPIGGIYSGLCQCPEDALFVTACDMPLIDQTMVEQVCECYRQHPGRIIMTRAGGRLHPLFGIYPGSSAKIIKQMIDEKDYKVRNLVTRTEVSVIELEHEIALKNVNTPQEYKELEKIARNRYGTETESF